MSNPRFRLAGPDDHDTIVEMTARAYAPYTEAFGAPPLPVTDDYRARIAKGEVWLAEIDGMIAGSIVIETLPDHLVVFSVVVSPAMQGRGVGVALMKFAEHKAGDAAVPEIRLYTNDRMTRNIALYVSLGYRETGRRPNPYRKGWILVDMAKRLTGD